MPTCERGPRNSLLHRTRTHVQLGITYGKEGGRDIFEEGDCDECFAQLAQELGLMDKLMERYDLLPEASQQLLDRVNGGANASGTGGGGACDVD